MNNNNDINVLLADGCTKKEAEKALQRGTIVYSSISEYIHELKASGSFEGETAEKIRSGAYADIKAVSFNDHEFLVEYVN